MVANIPASNAKTKNGGGQGTLNFGGQKKAPAKKEEPK
jgi:hypothetical protein